MAKMSPETRKRPSSVKRVTMPQITPELVMIMADRVKEEMNIPPLGDDHWDLAWCTRTPDRVVAAMMKCFPYAIAGTIQWSPDTGKICVHRPVFRIEVVQKLFALLDLPEPHRFYKRLSTTHRYKDLHDASPDDLPIRRGGFWW
jgi:hypothetical protein